MTKVVFLCTYSDPELRDNIHFSRYSLSNLIRRLLGKSNSVDFAIWNKYAIEELEKFDNIDVHVIVAHSGISCDQTFHKKGITYHVVWSEADIIEERLKRAVGRQSFLSYKRFRKKIIDIILRINPDIVHLVGLENKHISMALLDLPLSIPVISQLTTLFNDDRFKNNYQRSSSYFDFSANVEMMLLKRSTYISGSVDYFNNIIKGFLPNPNFVDIELPLTEPAKILQVDKKYDFVYFAAGIQKACDIAIEAFGKAHASHPEITLDIIGDYSKQYKAILDKRIEELNLTASVTFEGKLPTHEDVINQIRFSKFALLPLKIDLISGTIRESMANGLPVVSTITPDTPKLNQNKTTILLSEVNDIDKMANNMILLIENPSLADEIRKNAFELASKRKTNTQIVQNWIKVYDSILTNDLK